MSIDKMKEFKKYDTVVIKPSDPLEENEKKIIEKEEKNEKYQIRIGFSNDYTSIQQKKTLIDMVDRLNVNHKVGKIWITMEQYNLFDEEMIRMMNEKWTNIYGLGIIDSTGLINTSIYQQLIEIVKQKTLLIFVMRFCGSLHLNSKAFTYIIKFNQIVKKKKGMELLWY